MKSNLTFVEQQYDAAKNVTRRCRIVWLVSEMRTRVFLLPWPKTQEEALTNEYNLTYSVYSELAKQMEQAKIAVNETTPILTIVEPVVVPIERSKPKGD